MITIFHLIICLLSSYTLGANDFIKITDIQAHAELLNVQQVDKTEIIYIVDGELMSAKEVDKLKIEDIEQMEYVKDKDKIKLYTDEEVDTVVLITTKNKKKEEE